MASYVGNNDHFHRTDGFFSGRLRPWVAAIGHLVMWLMSLFKGCWIWIAIRWILLLEKEIWDWPDWVDMHGCLDYTWSFNKSDELRQLDFLGSHLLPNLHIIKSVWVKSAIILHYVSAGNHYRNLAVGIIQVQCMDKGESNEANSSLHLHCITVWDDACPVIILLSRK